MIESWWRRMWQYWAVLCWSVLLSSTSPADTHSHNLTTHDDTRRSYYDKLTLSDHDDYALRNGMPWVMRNLDALLDYRGAGSGEVDLEDRIFHREDYEYSPSPLEYIVTKPSVTSAVASQALASPSSAAAATTLASQEYNALKDFYYSTNGPYWHWNITRRYQIGINPWNFSTQPNIQDPCQNQWQGLVCNCTIPKQNRCHVVDIVLVRYNITGVLPPVFEPFTFLQTLFLSQNNLTGSISSQFYMGLIKLQTLDLTSNRLEGSIASQVNQLRALKYFNLSSNRFMGTLPRTIYNLTHMEKIDLGYNGFQGKLSSQIKQWKLLEYFWIANNSFTGSLPPELFTLPRLNTFMIRNNGFIGTISTAYLNLFPLKFFDIGNNYFTGSLPNFSKAKCLQLEVFHINTNRFTGTITSTINSLRFLSSIYLYNNYFHGSFPSTFGSTILTLTSFSIRTNLLTGVLPDSMTHWGKVILFSVQTNFMEGSSALSYTDKPLLSVWEIGSNMFTGPSPVLSLTKIANISVLTVYSAGYNLFTGDIAKPVTTSKLVIFFNVRYNFLTGSIPKWLDDQLKVLNYINLSGNMFQGRVSNSFGLITEHLSELLLSNNQLTGKIPMSIANMEYLAQIDFSDNAFTGTVPSKLFTLSRLKTLSLSVNQFTGQLKVPTKFNVPDVPVVVQVGPQPVLEANTTVLETIDISDNAFTGTLPDVLFSIATLTTFLASGNCFEGTLSAQICNANLLENLVLDGLSTASACQQKFFPQLTFFTAFASKHPMSGSIPHCIFEMPKLQSLHLAGNGWTGSIPSYVNLSHSLVELSLAHNQLYGTIPHVFQHRYWMELDLSFNKLHGRLDSDMHIVNESNWLTTAAADSSSLSLQVNRLSGSIPTELKSLDDINILQGNIFSCSIDRDDIPTNDPNANTYICGSDEINIALYIWIAMIFCFAIFVFATIRVIYQQAHSTGCSSCNASATSTTTTSSAVVSVFSYAYWFHVYCLFHDYLDVYLDRSFRNSSSTRKQYSLLIFHQLLVSIRTVFLVIAVMMCVLLIPSYVALTAYAGIYDNSYAWQISAILLSGNAAGAVLTIEFAMVVIVVVYVFMKNIIGMYLTLSLERNRMKQEKKMLEKLKANIDVEDDHNSNTFTTSTTSMSTSAEHSTDFRMFSQESFRSATSAAKQVAFIAVHKLSKSWTQIYLSTLIGLFNFAAMILIDLVYVQAVLTKSSSTVLLIQIFLSIFKIFWNEIVLWGLYPLLNMSIHQAWLLIGKIWQCWDRTLPKKKSYEAAPVPAVEILQCATPTDASTNITTETNHMKPLPQLPTENDSSASSTTKKVVDWTYSFSKYEVQFLAFTMILNNVIIPSLSILIISTDCYYNAFFATPPTDTTSVSECDYFVSLEDHSRCLSYSESIATTTFEIPFTYRYQCSAAFVINFAIVHVFMFIIIGIVIPSFKAFLHYLQALLKSASTPAVEDADKNERKASPIVTCLKICMRMVQWLLPKHMQDIDLLENLSEADQQKVKFVDKNKLIVKLSAYLSIVLSYGVVFPPIAIIACFSVFSNTYFEQLSLARFLLQANQVGYLWCRKRVEKDTEGVVEVWYGIVWILAPVATFLYAWIIFDTIGDKYGWQVSVGPALLIFIFPFLCMLCKWGVEKSGIITMEDMIQRTAEQIISHRQSIVSNRRSRAFTIGFFMESFDIANNNPMLATAPEGVEMELADLKTSRASVVRSTQILPIPSLQGSEANQVNEDDPNKAQTSH